jgi:hypothetical protein
VEPHEYFQELGIPSGIIKGDDTIELETKEGLGTHVWVRKRIQKRAEQFHS